MCISWLKDIFSKPVNPETGTTVVDEPVTANTETNEPENNNTMTENNDNNPISGGDVIIVPAQKVNFHVLLDNGHASSTPGKRMQMVNGKWFFEYEFNRDVVRRIAEKLDKLGIPYEILVPEVDTDVALSARAARANEFCNRYGAGNCFFISVHSNAFGDGKSFNSARGWSIWTTKGSTKSDNYATIMYNVANEILPKYCMTTRAQWDDGDPDYEENFTVIYKTNCPAVLTENMFFTNEVEVNWLMTAEGRDVIADIHVEAIKRIIDSRK